MELLDQGLMPAGKMTQDGKVWVWLARATVAAFMMYFAMAGIASVLGLVACWRTSHRQLSWTAGLLFLAFAFGTMGTVLFHISDHYEMKKVSWPFFHS